LGKNIPFHRPGQREWGQGREPASETLHNTWKPEVVKESSTIFGQGRKRKVFLRSEYII
jgi:hypothetical protein